MDGRLFRTAIFSSLIFGTLGSAGCRLMKDDPKLPSGALPQPGDHAGIFGKSTQKFGPPKEEVAERIIPRGKPGQPMKPDTEVAFGDTELEAAFAEGKTAVERDHLIDSARQRYQRALKADPKHTGALAGLARLYSKIGDRDRAAQIFQEGLKLNPKNHELAYKMACAQAKAEDWPAACNACKLAIAHDPENRTYHKTYGYCAARAGQWDVAFETLMRVMPETEARYFLGRVLIDADRIAEGKQQLELALRLNPNHEAAQDALAEISAGMNPPIVVPQEPMIQQAGGR